MYVIENVTFWFVTNVGVLGLFVHVQLATTKWATLTVSKAKYVTKLHNSETIGKVGTNQSINQSINHHLNNQPTN